METVVPDWTYTLHLPHDPRAPRIARTALRAVLGGHVLAVLAETAEPLASEMVTNAYRHTEGPASMRLRGGAEAGRLRISVWDTHPTIPAPFDKPPGTKGVPLRPDPDPDADGGRGLQIVRQCAADWGAHRLGDEVFGIRGKLLWIELTSPDDFCMAA